jgi:hypothetical protein
MKRTLPQPVVVPRMNISSQLKRFFLRSEVKSGQHLDSIFSLACQRCAGFTTRPQSHKEKDY